MSEVGENVEDVEDVGVAPGCLLRRRSMSAGPGRELPISVCDEQHNLALLHLVQELRNRRISLVLHRRWETPCYLTSDPA